MKILIVERYSTGDQEERSGELAREVVRTSPDVFVSLGIALLRHSKQQCRQSRLSRSQPIQLLMACDQSAPWWQGVGVNAGIELWTKYLEMVREIVPMATKVGYLASRRQWDAAVGRTLSEVRSGGYLAPRATTCESDQ